MENIPTFWIALWMLVSGIFFLVAVIANLYLIAKLLSLRQALSDLGVRVTGLLESLDQTSRAVGGLAGDLEKTSGLVRDKSERLLLTAAHALESISARATLVSTILGAVLALARFRSERAKKKKERD